MRRSLVLALLFYGLLLTGLATLRGELVALALPLAVYLLAGLLSAPGEMNLEAQRNLDVERVAPGETVEVRLRLINRGARLEELAVHDEVPAGLEVVEGSATHLLRLDAGASIEWTYRVRGPRGCYASVTRLSAETGLSRRSVIRAIRQLVYRSRNSRQAIAG